QPPAADLHDHRLARRWRRPGHRSAGRLQWRGELGLDPPGVHREVLAIGGSEGRVRHDRPVEWDDGSTPSTVNSDSARRDRASACGRSAPTTMSLASIESNSPPITLPARTPASSRTPGPDGGSNTVTTPG